ncbi:MAG TPA: CoA-acylating methylmalonate-semialdehyde dehydrogenase [Candidatus Eisenbacteria bacterium]|nr:CoA-acylating methylmalonate-semialdehyde dehydrogenase [Candidatus Eisenbacteria bacterium]
MTATAPAQVAEALNYIGGEWRGSSTAQKLDVRNPATAEVIGRVPMSTAAEVDSAVEAADRIASRWRRTPPGERVQYLFALKRLLEDHIDEMARSIVTENGKTLAEATGELHRAIENVEVACGIPMLMQGYSLEDIAAGIDESMVRQPVGIVAAITPFNFPAMIPFWFLPYAIACGNCFLLKPSEKVPLTMQLAFRLLEQLDLPKGVIGLINGGRETVDTILDHPRIRAISFVGSTPVARYIYSRAATNGKRVQCQGGAKNHAIVLPDADLDDATAVVGESAFACAGQRCLAVSVAVTVGEAQKKFRDAIADVASSITMGYGLDDGVRMGPVITPESRARIEQLIAGGVSDGANVVRDGRGARVPNYESGNFVGPTVLDGVPPSSPLSATEVFGPVLSLVHANTLDEALAILSRSEYGNAASLFTTNGATARRFKYEAPAGNIGINVGVAAPIAYFPFSGWRSSFFGDLHAQGRDAIEFYTEKKVVIERWA